MQRGDLVDPVDLPHQDPFGQPASQLHIKAHLGGPLRNDLDSIGQPRRVETDLHLHRLEDRSEDRAATQLVLALGGLFLGDLIAVQLEARQLLRGPGDHHRAPTVADGQHRRKHRAHVLGELVQQLPDALRVDIGDRHHRRAVPQDRNAATTGHQGSGRTHQLGDREQLHVVGAAGLQRFDGKDALRVPGSGYRRSGRQVQPLALQRPHRSDLGQQDTWHRHRGRGQLLGRRDRVLGRQRPHPLQRLEADGPHHHKFLGDRLEEQISLTGQGGQFRLDAGRRHQLLERLQPGTALSTEGDRVRLAVRQPIHQSGGGTDEPPRACTLGGNPVVFVDRHVIYLPCPG